MKINFYQAKRPKSRRVFASSALFAVICAFFAANSTSAQAPAPNTSAASHESERAAQVRSLNNSILTLHGQVEDNASAAETVRGQATAVLAKRAAALEALAQADPRAALSFAFSPELLADLAAKFPESASLLEVQGIWQGLAEVSVTDRPRSNRSETSVRLRVGQRSFDVHFADAGPSRLKSGDSLMVVGMTVGTTMAAEGGTVQSTTLPAASCSTTGDQKTAVLLVNFPGSTLPATVTPQQMQSVFFGTSGQSVDGYLREASYGLSSASGDVYGPFTLTGSYASCGTALMENDAIAAASAAGVNLQMYSRFVVVFADSIGCGWSGLATVGCSTLNLPSGPVIASNAFLSADYANVQVATHEMGHNLGLQHAQARDFGTEALGPLGTAGTVYEYGNEFSTMGNWTAGHYAAPHKAEVLNWLSQGTDYEVVQGNGSYTLSPLEAASGGLRALKVQRGSGNAGSYLWIEYRQPIGNYDTTYYTSQIYSGAAINYEDSTTGSYTHLIDFTPNSDTSNGEASDFGDPALAAGRTWVDPYSDLSISVSSATSSGLPVSIGYSGVTTCSPANPSLVLSPLNPSAYAGQSVGYSALLTNKDTVSCPSTTFTLSSSQPSGWTTSLSQSALTLAPGQSIAVAMNKNSPSGTAPGTYGVNISATSSSSGQSASANATIITQPGLLAALSTSGTNFVRPGSVSIAVSVTNAGAPTPGANATFTLQLPNGNKAVQNAVTDSTGTATWIYKLNQKSPPGTYSVTVQVSLGSTSKKSANTQSVNSNTATFTVQ
jgi:M6 family metalloprotease-like protein